MARTPPAATASRAQIGEQFFAAGADVVAIGDHCWDQAEADRPVCFDREPRIIPRPLNVTPGAPQAEGSPR